MTTMKLRIDKEMMNGMHYYTQYDKNGVYMIMEDRGVELDSRVVFKGTYEQCADRLDEMYKESCVTW